MPIFWHSNLELHQERKKMRKYKLEITVFLCGAIGMILELVAARVLSPYVGSSNLIWTTIIGVMLTSMSLGYWIGGKFADKKPEIGILSNFILLGAIFTSLIPIMETLLVENLIKLSGNLVVIAFIAAAVVFGMPSFVIAIVSPYAVRLKDKELEEVGKISGKTSSLSTIGSIVGTFLAGFFLIPTFGVRTIVLGVTILLLLISIMLYPHKTKKYFAIIILVTICLIAFPILGKILFEKNHPEIIQDVDSEYSRIWVLQAKNEDTTFKTLQVDTGRESYINENTGEMGAKYLYYYDLAEVFNSQTKNTLMIGGAAYTYPMHYLKKYPEKTIDVVEIDSKMTQLAQEEFGLDTQNKNLKIYHQDGRSYLNTTENKYDCILIDAFKGLNTPFELTTFEAMINARNCLNENGVVITNIISSLEGDDADFIQYEYATYQKVFDEVKIFQVHDIEKQTVQNLILVGIKGNPTIAEEKREEYAELLQNEVTDFTTDKEIVTDNYAPIGN